MPLKVWESISNSHNTWDQMPWIFVLDFDVKKCPYLNRDSITSIDEFNAKPSKKWSHARIFPKLDALQKWLRKNFNNDVDPIQYLIYLYYEKELSTYEILERTQALWFPYQNQSSLHKLFTRSFWWKLRDNKEMTERRKRKISRKSSPSLQWLKKSKEKLWEENSKKFHDSLIQILDLTHTVKNWFSIEQYHSFDKKSDKIFYLLETYEDISFKVLCDIAKNTNMWWTSLARIINNKLENIHKCNPDIELLTISPAMIHTLLKRHWIKQ